MSSIKALERECDREFEAGLRVRERLGSELRHVKEQTEEVFRSEAGLIGAFAAGVLVDQLRRSPDENSAEATKSTGGDDANGGFSLTSLLLRAAIPYAIQEFIADDAGSATTDA